MERAVAVFLYFLCLIAILSIIADRVHSIKTRQAGLNKMANELDSIAGQVTAHSLLLDNIIDKPKVTSKRKTSK